MADMADSKVRIKDEDWSALFPSEDFKIGSTTVHVKALSVEGVSIITARLSEIGAKVTTLNISLDESTNNVGDLSQLVHVILEDAPDILSELTGVHEDDIKKLPVATAVDLFNKALDVNVGSQSSLVKNLKLLGNKFNQFLSPETDPTSTSRERAHL